MAHVVGPIDVDDLPTLLIVPDANGYKVEFSESVISTDLPGGLSRTRVDFINSTGTADVQWTCNPLQFQYLTAFKRKAINKGANPFLCYLISDDELLKLYVVKFVPKTFHLVGQSGLTYIVAATLEVVPSTADDTADQSIIDTFTKYGDGSAQALALLQAIASQQSSASAVSASVALNITQLINAMSDVLTIQAFVNSQNDTVSSRLGYTYPTLYKISQTLGNLGSYPVSAVTLIDQSNGQHYKLSVNNGNVQLDRI